MSGAALSRLASRTIANYGGFNYSNTLPDDFVSLATIAPHVCQKFSEVVANAATIGSVVAPTQASKEAASNSASSAAGMVSLLAQRPAARDINDPRCWSVLRSTPFWSFDSVGVIEETAVDGLPWGFDPVTRAPRGVAFAGPRTNSWPNPRAEGGATGAPGTLPTSWVWTTSLFTAAGITPSITLLGTIAPGINFVRIRLTTLGGTTTAAGSVSLTHSAVIATQLQTWNSRWFLRLFSGSAAPFTLLGPRARTTTIGGTQTASVEVNAKSLVTSAWQSFSAQVTAPADGANVTARATNILQFNWPTSANIEMELDLAVPHLELAPFISQPILPVIGTPAVSTRAGGTIDIPVSAVGSNYNRRAGTIIVNWSSLSGAFTSSLDTDFMTIISLGDGSLNNIMALLINPNHNSLVFRRTANTIVQSTASVSITPPAAGVLTKAAFSWDIDSGFMQVARNGAVGTLLSNQLIIPTVTHIMLGRWATTRYLFGSIAELEIHPAAAFGSALQALAS